MGDHCVLVMDELLDQHNIEAGSEGRNRIVHGITIRGQVLETQFTWRKRNAGGEPSLLPETLVECRICKEEELVKNLEAPCSCRGSLKYAHRKCIQKWSNEKGNTTCEICLQDFQPGYTVKPRLLPYGTPSSPMYTRFSVLKHLHPSQIEDSPILYMLAVYSRGHWGLPHHGLHEHEMASSFNGDASFLDLDYDYNLAPSSTSLTCWRVVAVIFTCLLILRHILSITIIGGEESFLASLTTWVLLTAGVLVPVYIMARMLSAIQSRQQHQGHQGIPLHLEDEWT